MGSKKKTIKAFFVSLSFLLLLTIVEVFEVFISRRDMDFKALPYIFMSVFTIVFFKGLLKPILIKFIDSKKTKEPTNDSDNHDLR